MDNSYTTEEWAQRRDVEEWVLLAELEGGHTILRHIRTASQPRLGDFYCRPGRTLGASGGCLAQAIDKRRNERPIHVAISGGQWEMCHS